MPYNPPASKDHETRGLARFIEQYRDKTKLNALARSYLKIIQEIENAAWEVILYRLLTNAEGEQLDMIGRIVGRGRNDLPDSDYLLAIRAQIRINRSSGTPEDLIDVARLTLPAGFTFTFEEQHPATVFFTVSGAVNFSISLLLDNLKRAKAGGVRLFLEYSEADDENTFTFASGDVVEVDANQGFADDAGATGGVLSEVLT